MNVAWGFGTSAYQIEGAWNVDGKSPSIWDTWYNDPSRQDKPNAFVANDHYHRMKEDIGYLGQLGATAYRFSVAWSRILPDCSGKVNEAGIKFYSDMIDEIIRNGAMPILTMYHWDIPQSCHDQYQSWMNRKVIDDFTNYADVLFQNYGDRVQYFLTLNEPSAQCGFGYAQKFWPPGLGLGEPARYVCQHYVNLAHASVVQLARTKYKDRNFKFGMPLIATWGEPLTNTQADLDAQDRYMAFQTKWNWGPLIDGDYPDLMKKDKVIGHMLPEYTDSEKTLLKGTIDFIAINYYSAIYVSNSPGDEGDFKIQWANNDGVGIGPVSGTSWQSIFTPGIRGILKWLHKTFPQDIFITECGTSVKNEDKMSLAEVVNDSFRQNFFEGITNHISQAVNIDKVPLKAFLAWSLVDNFEWNTYEQRFGVIAINRTDGTLTRTIKNSAVFLKNYFAVNAKTPFYTTTRYLTPTFTGVAKSEEYANEFSSILLFFSWFISIL
ncbi:glycosyl hydrolase family protein [Globomyces pollinis-pini]|nr:glycosyl hydrolase family protein [Globomyces pollinis-pini]